MPYTKQSPGKKSTDSSVCRVFSLTVNYWIDAISIGFHVSDSKTHSKFNLTYQ